jgi:hypothetical protein
MNERESMLQTLLAHLEKARAYLGPVNPQFSYYQRLVNVAQVNDEALPNLYYRVQIQGGFVGL